MTMQTSSPKPRPRTRTQVDLIVREIAEMMVKSLWVRGASEDDLARREGLSPLTIRGYATSASRLLTLTKDADSLEEFRVATLSSLERHARKAELWASEPGGNRRGLRDATLALSEAAKIAGVPFVVRDATAALDVATAERLGVGIARAVARSGVDLPMGERIMQLVAEEISRALSEQEGVAA
jgi:DNA-binding CsgD family transcriptional regulator